MYSEQHIVKTELGTFSLDDAAYAAYLEGKLWINWTVGRRKSEKASAVGKPFIPLNVSDEAICLRDAAARQDVYSFLQQQFPGREVPVPYRERMSELTIDEMNLSRKQRKYKKDSLSYQADMVRRFNESGKESSDSQDK